MNGWGRTGLCAGVALLLGAAPAPDYRSDALALTRTIADHYAYLDRFPDRQVPASSLLDAEAAAVSDRKGLIRHAERRLATLADHHAITGQSLADSRALVPSRTDLWIVRRPHGYLIEAVRASSAAARADVRAGDMLIAIDGAPIAHAVHDYWRELGLANTIGRAEHAARVLAAGRRDRDRKLTIARPGGATRTLSLANLYGPTPDRPPVTREGATIRTNDALGDDATIAAFDAAMSAIPADAPLTIDLTDTPSGGNTRIARAILGWFVDQATPYQQHSVRAEGGIARGWLELVYPRPLKRHRGRVTVRVGRWTASMGEGLAIGFAAIGARVEGTRMAGLLGAVDDIVLPASGLTLRLPHEQLWTVDNQPRESFAPQGSDGQRGAIRIAPSRRTSSPLK